MKATHHEFGGIPEGGGQWNPGRFGPIPVRSGRFGPVRLGKVRQGKVRVKVR